RSIHGWFHNPLLPRDKRVARDLASNQATLQRVPVQKSGAKPDGFPAAGLTSSTGENVKGRKPRASRFPRINFFSANGAAAGQQPRRKHSRQQQPSRARE